MTEQELIKRAIESAKCRIYRVKANEGDSHRHQTKVANQVELQLVTIKALEKQIAKKPIGISVNEDNMRIANCPSCKKLIVQKESPVGCKHCLQALDWGNEDAE